eukprot:TRINITY_DN10081_c0_g1_i1.p1 TRINITY_DN10081_c0_g1~~TRINITY_DN10081_c0_g1_i1.p1  ORF type:complete len:382 (+),score=133.08 TRINITY_DN10081_c0_g1_i1:27-1148(+)
MLLGVANKKYGLQPRKPAAEEPKLQKKNVFGNEDDDDDDVKQEPARDAVNRAWSAQQNSAHQQRQIQQAEAELEKAGLLEFDSWLDMKARDDAKKVTAKREAERKAKFIEMRMAAQKQRQMELDLLKERRLKKERDEQEKELGEPEEAFVTSAWKEKLAEMEHYQAQIQAKDLADEARAATTDFAGSVLKFREAVLGGNADEPQDEEDEELQYGMVAERILPKERPKPKPAAQPAGSHGAAGQGGEADDDGGDEEFEEDEEAAADGPDGAAGTTATAAAAEKEQERREKEEEARVAAEGGRAREVSVPASATGSNHFDVDELAAQARLERRRRRWEKRTTEAELFSAHQRFLTRQAAREKQLQAALPVATKKK